MNTIQEAFWLLKCRILYFTFAFQRSKLILSIIPFIEGAQSHSYSNLARERLGYSHKYSLLTSAYLERGSEAHSTTMPANFGSKKPLSPEHTREIQSYLTQEMRWRDLALFMLGVDTLLRSCDLLQLKYEDVIDVHGNVRTYLTRLQNKTRRPVECYVSEPTRCAVKVFVEKDNKHSGDYLFTRLRPRKGQNSNRPISRKAFAELVKIWVSAIGLDPTRYSTKTLRKSRVRPILEKAKFDYQVPRLLLGHADIRSTVYYCAIAEETALQISSEVQFFDPLNLTGANQE